MKIRKVQTSGLISSYWSRREWNYFLFCGSVLPFKFRVCVVKEKVVTLPHHQHWLEFSYSEPTNCFRTLSSAQVMPEAYLLTSWVYSHAHCCLTSQFLTCVAGLLPGIGVLESSNSAYTWFCCRRESSGAVKYLFVARRWKSEFSVYPGRGLIWYQMEIIEIKKNWFPWL